MNPRLSLQYLTNRLRRLRNVVLLNHVGVGLTLILTALAMLLVVGFLVNSAFYLTTTFRLIFVTVAAIVVVALFVHLILWKLLRRPSAEAVALDVEKTYPQLQNRLIASLQLERNLQQNREGFSMEMIEAVISQSEAMCRDIDFKKSVDQRPLRKGLRWFSPLAILVMAIALLFPGAFRESVYLFSHPTLEIPRNLSYSLDVRPKSIEIAKFAPVTIRALLHGKSLPQGATLYWRYEDGPVKTEELAREASTPALTANLILNDTAKLSYEIREVKKSFEYWVAAGEIKSPVYSITAVDKPRVIGLKLTYMYPAYTGLQPLVVDENDGNISAIKGTKVKVEASVNKTIAGAFFKLSNGETVAAEISKQKLSGTLPVMENGSYHIALTDEIGNDNPDPIEYRIETIADMYPEVDLYAPGVPVNLGDDMALNLGFKLFDDFGFSTVNLIYRLYGAGGEAFERKVAIVFDRKAGRSFEIAYPWDLSDIGLEPGGYVEYFIEAFDNDNISGPKRGVSQILTARLPSLDEQFAYLEEEGEAQISDLEQLKKEQEELLQKTEELKQEMLTNKEMDWEKKQEVQKALQSQQDILDAMQKVGEKMQQMEDQMKKNDMTSLEILQKLQEIQKLYEKVATPEMKEAMRKMQEALNKMTPEEMKKAAEEMQMSQKELKDKLDRTIALLKFMQIQQKMEDMMRQLNELVKKQEDVNKQTTASAPQDLPKLAPTEEQNKAQFDKLQEQAKELEKMLAEQKLDQNEAAKKFTDAPKNSTAGEKMSSMAGKLSQQDQKESQQKGEAALDDLKQMLKEMQEQKDSFNSSMGQQSAEKMKGAANDLLYVSDQQEKVYDKAEKLDPTSPQLQQLAAEQQALQRTMESLDSKLKAISKESAFYSQQISKMMKQAQEMMDQSANGLMDRNASAAMRSQKEAMFSLNQAANQLMQSMQNQKQCTGGSCNNENLFKKMNKLSNSQKQINQKSSAMCNNPSLGSSNKQEMGRLAAEQGAVQKSLQELQREKGARKEILGRLDELGKEVKKVVEDLEGGTINENTTRRQQQIYSRMLDFQRSMERQDFSEERKAETAEDIVRQSPPPVSFDALKAKESYQDRLQKYLNEGFPPEYEELIKEYFRAINSGQPEK
jgi:hypothetical protein